MYRRRGKAAASTLTDAGGGHRWYHLFGVRPTSNEHAAQLQASTSTLSQMQMRCAPMDETRWW